EARVALDSGLNVMLFSDNVGLYEEIELKRLALDRGLLLMGPDCGTAHIAGVALGVANEVPRGRGAIVAASCTGLQQVATLVAARCHGFAPAGGGGGREMSGEIGGLMTLAGLELMGEDRATELIVGVGKPPAPAVAERVRSTLLGLGTPAVICLLGRDV